MEDFEWARDVNHLTYEYLNGKALLFDPVISGCDKHLRTILDCLREMGFTVDFNRDDTYIRTRSLVGLYCDDPDGCRNSRVVWTGDTITTEKYQSHINDYGERFVEVINGWDVFPKDLFE